MKFREFIKESSSSSFDDEWSLSDEDGEEVKIDVEIFYESSGGRGKDRYHYPLKVKIAKTFRHDGKTYTKNSEFPKSLEKYVIGTGKKKFEEWLYDRVNEIGN